MLINNLNINNYKNIILGCRNSDDKPNYFVEDFLDKKILVDFIVNTYDHETTFTKKGFEFIEAYYGIDAIVSMVIAEHPNYPFDKNLSPLEALMEKKEFAIDMDVLKK